MNKTETMKKQFSFLVAIFYLLLLTTFTSYATNGNDEPKNEEFQYQIDQFADIRIIRYQIPGFEDLDLRQKKLLYYLSQAALCGRDITFDQNFKHNLFVRKTLDAIVESYTGDRKSENFKKFMTYTKRIWFANGIHHHYSTDKFIPGFTEEYFKDLVLNSNRNLLPLQEHETTKDLIEKIIPIMFDKDLFAKKIETAQGEDIVSQSAVNFYEGVTMTEVDDYYESIIVPNDQQPISYGLNSKVVKEDGEVKEIVWKEDGMYGEAISKIIYWLEKAKTVAENETQEKEFELLVEYYRTGDLKVWDEYNVLWAGNTDVTVDYVNGFIEVYDDPKAMKATWESVVNVKNLEETKRTETLSNAAQWFEDHSPVDSRFKKDNVTGVSAKVIDVVQLGGACYPNSPAGINLPNADWIRKEYGSKSVTLSNITYAYGQGASSGFFEEFFDTEVQEVIREYSIGDLHTDLHEVVGHGSGQLLPGTDPGALKGYQTPLEEARAELFGLYYLPDEKLVELGLTPSTEAANGQYEFYLTNGLLTQMSRIQLGKNVEQAHMRARQLIAQWVYEKGKKDNVVEMYKKEGETFVKVNDYKKLRELFGELLAEIQRIKSEGDYEAGKNLVENYGVKLDQELHKEVLERYATLKRPSGFGGFVNPNLVPVMEDDKIIDVKVEYPKDYVKQMLRYGKEYSFLPVYN